MCIKINEIDSRLLVDDFTDSANHLLSIFCFIFREYILLLGECSADYESASFLFYANDTSLLSSQVYGCHTPTLCMRMQHCSVVSYFNKRLNASERCSP